MYGRGRGNDADAWRLPNKAAAILLWVARRCGILQRGNLYLFYVLVTGAKNAPRDSRILDARRTVKARSSKTKKKKFNIQN